MRGREESGWCQGGQCKELKEESHHSQSGDSQWQWGIRRGLGPVTFAVLVGHPRGH